MGRHITAWAAFAMAAVAAVILAAVLSPWRAARAGGTRGVPQAAVAVCVVLIAVLVAAGVELV